MATLETTSFDQLQALRNVQLIARNEYPLKHLSPEKVRRRSRRDDEEEENARCFCTHPDPIEQLEHDVRRCDDVSCLNFATYVECSASCDAGMYCRNQRLQHPEHFPVLEAFKTEKKGYGVRTKEFIPQLSLVGEYVGEIIDEVELTRRLQSVPRQELNFYYLLLAPGIYIDARSKGSFTRFVNHSCAPNCKTEKWTVNGEDRIAVSALEDIHPGDELTFDYKWKALGSRPITCFCGAPTCKGVIGTNTTSGVHPDASSGFFRDPEKTETGHVLVGRQVRVFLSVDDKTVYDVQRIKAYDEVHDRYEVDGGLDVDGSDSEDTASDQVREEKQFVRLQENGWQVYCEETGEHVFAIPKKRIVPSLDGVKDVPWTSIERGQGAVATERPDTRVCVQRTNEMGEVLDREGKVVSAKLLIKFLPKEYDERLLRTLFTSRKHPTALQSAQVFHFLDGTGWGLVELETHDLATWFRRTLDRRNLLDKMLRVYPAGAKEIERFRQQKAKLETMRQGGATDGWSVSPLKEQEPPTDKRQRAYCFGRKLDWLVTEEDVKQVAVQQKLSVSLEETLRVKYVKGIFHIAKGLRLDREDATSAILALNRYFTFHAMPMDVDMYAATMLYLFLKAHARKVPYDAFVKEVYKAKHGAIAAERLTATSPELNAVKRHLVKAEGELLEGLHYDITGQDPYALLDVLTTRKSAKKSGPGTIGSTFPFVSALPPPEVQKEAKHLVAEALPLPIWTHNCVECVMLSIVYVSAAVIEALSVKSASRSSRLPDYLPQLDVQTNALEARRLLTCSLSICWLLKERWIRLEKQSKVGAQKQLKKHETPGFDMQQFDVSNDKMDMEISNRIARILKQWLQLSGSTSTSTSSLYSSTSARYSSDKKFVTFKTMQSSLPLVDAITSHEKRDNEPMITALSIFSKRTPASNASGDERLYTDAIIAVESIRKRAFLGTISSDVNFDLAGKAVYLQSWPYLEQEQFLTEDRGMNDACLRELSAATTFSALAPDRFMNLYGIIFPVTRKTRPSSDTSTENGTDELELLAASVDEDGNVVPEGIDRLAREKHYLAFEQPLHMFSGIFEAHVSLDLALRKKAIFDMLQSLAIVHEQGYVHRFIAPSHLLVFSAGIKLGGFHAMRKVATLKSKEGERSPLLAYDMSDSERKEHCYGAWLYVTAPEVLLGETKYTWRADMWSAGCVALAILLDKVPFLRGQDVKVQLDLIYRLCGTPSMSWEGAHKLPSYNTFRPKHEYKMRLRKTLLEQRATFTDLTEEAVDVLEAMLQLDPARRSPIKKLLAMRFFDSVRQQRACTFHGLAPTFPVQKVKLVQHLVKSKAKRHRPSHRHASHRHHSEDASRFKRLALEGISKKKHERHKARSDKKKTKSGRRERTRTVTFAHDNVELYDDVPLPKSFIATLEDSTTHATDDKLPRQAKRAKLDWGMGLNADS